MKVTGVKLARRAGNRCGVELLTDSGLKGIALADARSRAQIRRLVADHLLDADPRSVTGHWQRMASAVAPRRPALPALRAIAALDVALWDLKAKANGEPLWRTLGGARPRANAYASCRDSRLGDGDLSAWFRRMAREHGLRGGKLAAVADNDANLRRLGLMREALAPVAAEPALMLDAKGAWPADTTLAKLRSLEESFDLTWVEGAAGERDARGLRRISDAISAAVCVGAGLATIADFRLHFERRSVDVVQLDIGAVGITGAIVIADAAFGLELPVALAALPGNVHAHLAGVIPGFMAMEVVDAAGDAPDCATDVRIEEGWAVAGDAHGTGLVLQ